MVVIIGGNVTNIKKILSLVWFSCKRLCYGVVWELLPKQNNLFITKIFKILSDFICHIVDKEIILCYDFIRGVNKFVIIEFKI